MVGCGICGENWALQPKIWEKYGAKYTGQIVATYSVGQQINVQVVVSFYH